MRETFVKIITTKFMYKYSNNVIIRNNSPAYFIFIRKYASETKYHNTWSSIIEDKCGTSDYDFCQWFVGYTDGDGCFSIYVNTHNRKINLTYKLSQRIDNIQVLYFIKKKIGVGVVRKDKEDMAHYLVRDVMSLQNSILPIFNNHKLKTKKYYDFLKFKDCLNIYADPSLSQIEKINLINSRKLVVFQPQPFLLKRHLDITSLSKLWIVGFVEAEGSFYLTEKENKSIVHGFAISQKEDVHLLICIARILKIKANIKQREAGFYMLDSTNANDLKFIKDYFFNTMKSKKAFIYRVWARSFRDKGKYDKLKKLKLTLNRMKV